MVFPAQAAPPTSTSGQMPAIARTRRPATPQHHSPPDVRAFRADQCGRDIVHGGGGVVGGAANVEPAGIQALPAQQRTLLALLGRVMSAKICSLHFAVKVLRFARSGTCGSGRAVWSSSTRTGSAIPTSWSSTPNVIVISGISIPAHGSVIVRK